LSGEEQAMIECERDEPSRGQGHPLPGSEEAREDEIPEHLVREKGHGDDCRAPVQPADDAAAPDGESYPADRR
jgi:hypothetical protein